MKLSWHMLREFVSVRVAPQHLAELLTLSGTEVGSVRSLARGLDQVIVGEVLTLVQHPHADRLKVAKVRLSPAADPVPIVCGAPNIRAGQKVAVARVGVRLPGGETIERRMIRGVESLGMICAPDELGLGADHTGVLVLGSDLALGTPLEKALGFDDTVLDLEITPNRPDCLSALGIAREVSALTATPLKWKPPLEKTPNGKTPFRVTVRDRVACPQYEAHLIRGVNVAPSPQWLQNRLTATGFRPVNTVVDITNYVMLELGQPLHTFDAKKVGPSLVVRRARAGERLTVLDGKTYALDPSMLVIADRRKPVALAGVMGGKETEIGERTTSVVLECARFAPAIVRKASRKLGLMSESSYRFERGVDPSIGPAALRRAIALLAELAGGTPVGPGVRVAAKPPPPLKVRTTAAAVSATLGVPVPQAKVRTILSALGFGVKSVGASLEATVPTWRSDVRLPRDLTEEVGRLQGYNTFKPTLPSATLAPHALPPDAALRRDVRHRLARQGLVEIVQYSYLSGKLIDASGGDRRQWLCIANPLSEEQEYLRATLMPHVAQALSANERFAADVALFEVGTTFLSGRRGSLPTEETHCAIGIAGHEALRRVKGQVEALLAGLGVPAVRWLAVDDRRIEMRSGTTVLGMVSIVPPSLAQFVKLRRAAAVAELSLPMLEKARRPRTYAAPSPYQPVVRDLSLWFPVEAPFGAIEEAVRAASPLIVDVEVFDVFADEQRVDRKSVAFHVVFRARDRTLRSEEVDAVMERITRTIGERFHGEVRKS